MRNNRKNSIIIFNNIRRDKGSLHKHDMWTRDYETTRGTQEIRPGSLQVLRNEKCDCWGKKEIH
jgi:hypothetical protein